MRRESHVRFCESGGVKLPSATRRLAKAMEPPASGQSASLTNSPTITSPVMVTGIGILLGTAAYMSPEQARGRAVDKRSDICLSSLVWREIDSALLQS
jgi:eukaryotic-like serine/threonine-protein kinase